MKTISLSVMAIAFACATVFANSPVVHAKAKNVSCINCGQQKCAKACIRPMCPKGACKM